MKVTLASVKKYHDLIVVDGQSRTEAFKSVFRKNAKKGELEKIEGTDEFKMITVAMDRAVRQNLQEEMIRLQSKRLRSYEKLIDMSDDMLDEAKSMQDKLSAHKNMRANLLLGVVETVDDWNGDGRNQREFGASLEGVIVD